jgi:hypothetical protein
LIPDAYHLHAVHVLLTDLITTPLLEEKRRDSEGCVLCGIS